MTKQEMFDRAYKGLRAQQWRRSANDSGECLYKASNGDRCAWGHVDPEGTECMDGVGNVRDLSLTESGGLAYRFDQAGRDDLLDFGTVLQRAHDNSTGGAGMEAAFKALAYKHGLAVPE